MALGFEVSTASGSGVLGPCGKEQVRSGEVRPGQVGPGREMVSWGRRLGLVRF